jgi:hypothetical protein
MSAKRAPVQLCSVSRARDSGRRLSAALVARCPHSRLEDADTASRAAVSGRVFNSAPRWPTNRGNGDGATPPSSTTTAPRLRGWPRPAPTPAPSRGASSLTTSSSSPLASSHQPRHSSLVTRHSRRQRAEVWLRKMHFSAEISSIFMLRGIRFHLGHFSSSALVILFQEPNRHCFHCLFLCLVLK